MIICKGLINMVNTPFTETLIQSHQFQGSTNHCGPFCAAMTINTLTGNHLSGLELSNKIPAFRWFGIVPVFQRFPNWATLPWAVSSVIKDSGLSSGMKLFASISDILTCLESNRIPIVVVGEWRPMWAHYMIAVCYDYANGFGFIDPALQTKEISWVSQSIFERRWKLFGRILIWAELPEEILLKD